MICFHEIMDPLIQHKKWRIRWMQNQSCRTKGIVSQKSTRTIWCSLRKTWCRSKTRSGCYKYGIYVKSLGARIKRMAGIKIWWSSWSCAKCGNGWWNWWWAIQLIIRTWGYQTSLSLSTDLRFRRSCSRPSPQHSLDLAAYAVLPKRSVHCRSILSK